MMSSAATLKPSSAATANRSRHLRGTNSRFECRDCGRAPRRHVQAFLQRVIDTAGDQEAALSSVGVVELVYGIHRADTAERRARREGFVEELLSTVAIYPLTTDIARLAGKLDAQLQSRGIVVPFADLLIGATALSLGDSVLTANARHFGRIPGLSVIQL